MEVKEEREGGTVEEEEDEERKWKTRWRSREEGGPAPCCLSLNTPRRSLFPSLPSFSFSFTHSHTHTQTVPDWHTRVLLQLNRHSMKPRLRETERGREDSTPHEHYPWKTQMRRERERKEGSVGRREEWVERTEVKWCDDGGNDGENCNVTVLLAVVITVA